jgi:hypothetical protein
MSFKECVRKLNGEMIQHLKVDHCLLDTKRVKKNNCCAYSAYILICAMLRLILYSSTSHVSMGQYSEYTDEYETYWVEFMALFNSRRKRESRSPTQLYNILSIEIGLSASTLASFYRHQKELL